MVHYVLGKHLLKDLFSKFYILACPCFEFRNRVQQTQQKLLVRTLQHKFKETRIKGKEFPVTSCKEFRGINMILDSGHLLSYLQSNNVFEYPVPSINTVASG